MGDCKINIRELVQKRMNEHHISQQVLARHLGISQGHLCRFLCQDGGMSIDKLDRLLDVLGANGIDWKYHSETVEAMQSESFKKYNIRKRKQQERSNNDD